MADWLLGGKPVETMVTLIGWITAQELPRPIGIAHSAQVLVIVEFGGPVGAHVEPSTRHTAPRTSCSMGLRMLRRTSSICSVLYYFGMKRCRVGAAASPSKAYVQGAGQRGQLGTSISNYNEH